MAEETAHITVVEKQRERQEVAGSQYFHQGHTPNDLIPPTRFYLLKVLPFPNSTKVW
jgi:hypothetical protein